MKLLVWKTVQSREGRPDEFWYSFGKETVSKRPFFLFSCSETEAREAFGDEIDKIVGLNVVHPITLILSIRIVDE